MTTTNQWDRAELTWFKFYLTLNTWKCKHALTKAYTNTKKKEREKENLESASCRNFPSKLTRSTSSLKIGASSHACCQWLSGNGMGNKANGAWTMPTPGTVPDLCNLNPLPSNTITNNFILLWFWVGLLLSFQNTNQSKEYLEAIRSKDTS